MIYNLSFVINISIHAPHEGERHLGDAYVWGAQGISIHAPHEGERHGMIYNLSFVINISIHAPHEGERPCGAFATHNRKEIFQSTLPTRGSDLIKSL